MIPVLYWSNYSTLTTGGQKSLSYILRDLDRTAYLPVLACREEGPLTELARGLGIPVELIDLPPAMRPRHLMRIVRFILALRGLADKYGIRILHSEELTVVFMAAFLKPFRKIKTIWHVRILWDTPFQKLVGLSLSDAVACVSQAVAASFPGSSKKLKVIPNGIDPDEFAPGGERAVSHLFGPEDTVIGQIGTLSESKNSALFIRAASLVLKTHPEAKFLLVGEGSDDYMAYLRQLIAGLGVGRSVFLTGKVTDIKPLLKRLDVVCLLSKTEGLSRVLLESMAAEKAVVVSGIPQNTELVADNVTGLVAKTGSAEDAASKITALLDDRDVAARLGRAARQRVIDNFSLGKTIEGVHALYASLTGGGAKNG